MPLQLQKRQLQRELTFKARVERFWEWYAETAARLYRMLEADQENAPPWSSSEEAAEVSAKVDELLPDFAWVFGPGEKGYGEPGRSFTLASADNSGGQKNARPTLFQPSTGTF